MSKNNKRISKFIDAYGNDLKTKPEKLTGLSLDEMIDTSCELFKHGYQSEFGYNPEDENDFALLDIKKIDKLNAAL
jgi:hypothetical protein